MKKYLVNIIFFALLVILSVVFLFVGPENNWYWFLACFMWVGGVGILLQGIFVKDVSIKKAAFVLSGIAFALGFLFMSYANDWIAQRWIAFLFVFLAIALFAGGIFGIGHKWDKGDNEKEGYKNYYQRKEEEAKKLETAKIEEEKK